MQDWTCKLILNQYAIDEIGNQVLVEEFNEIPIIDVEDVYQSEFYNASQQGMKPSLRLVVSNLNYHDEEQLEYMGKRYSIIRVDMVDYETLALVCEKRTGLNKRSEPSE